MSVEQVDLTSYHVAISTEEEGDRRLEKDAESAGRMGAGTRERLAKIAATFAGDMEETALEAVAQIAEAEEEQRIARGRLETARGRLETAPGQLETARAQLASATERLKAAEAEGWRIEGEIISGARVTRKADTRPRDSAPPGDVYAVPVAAVAPDDVDVAVALTATQETPDGAPMETTATAVPRRQMTEEALWGAAAPRQQEARPRVDLWSDPPAIAVLDAPIPEALQRDAGWTDDDDLPATLPPRSSRNMAKPGRTSYRELYIVAGTLLGSLVASALILLATHG